jgi:hypothetical protein
VTSAIRTAVNGPELMNGQPELLLEKLYVPDHEPAVLEKTLP